MALGVFLVWPGQGAEDGELVTLIEWHLPPYVYLEQFWPPTSSTGRLINPLGETSFSGPNLPQLSAALQRAATAIQARPRNWSETVGSRSAKGHRSAHLKLKKAEVKAMIEILSAAVHEAEASGRALLFSGD